ncbi:lysozyme [Enterobacteriaceae bacterium BIT-l23]|uniref:lysozyme n=1 Tax=Jejubacter sp. L23 TaxID=3092086 RepID=UPI0015850FBB|nr:lysozyme [Enterobacteriaceae bacterium BIT-l23]
MKISDAGIALIKRFEGCHLNSYPDPGTGDKPWSIGYGWTGTVDGITICPGMAISQQQAERLLYCGVLRYEQCINQLVRVNLTQNQFDALVCFVYNIGTYAFSTSTLLQKLNAGDYQGAADQFLRWVAPDKPKVTAGLQRRRIAERTLFLE